MQGLPHFIYYVHSLNEASKYYNERCSVLCNVPSSLWDSKNYPYHMFNSSIEKLGDVMRTMDVILVLKSSYYKNKTCIEKLFNIWINISIYVRS